MGTVKLVTNIFGYLFEVHCDFCDTTIECTELSIESGIILCPNCSQRLQ